MKRTLRKEDLTPQNLEQMKFEDLEELLYRGSKKLIAQLSGFTGVNVSARIGNVRRGDWKNYKVWKYMSLVLMVHHLDADDTVEERAELLKRKEELNTSKFLGQLV